MRNFFTLFVVMLLSLPVFAQEHLDFRGVPIDGHLDDFVTKMEGMGYTVKQRDGEIVMMTGQFTNNNVELWIVSSRQTKTVWKVVVDFSKNSSWSSLKNSYFEYKNLYTKKYGSNNKAFEFFSKPYYEGDGYELQALRGEKCTYATFFLAENGTITVALTKFENLQIRYEDKTNADKSSKEKTASALDEI